MRPLDRRHRLACGALLALLTASGCARELELPARPNILLVLADDLGYGDCRAYNPQSKIAMPNLERLARQGMRFTDFHSASAVCAPSRYSLATGNYAWRGRHLSGVWKAYGQPQILPGQRTLAELLKAAGYHTAKIGKDHLGGQFYRRAQSGFAHRPEEMDYSRPFLGGPHSRGYDLSFTLACGIQDPPYAFFRNDRLDGDPATLRQWDAGRHGDSEVRNPGIGASDWDSSTVGPRLLDEALAFLESHHQANLAAGTTVPFFLFYSAVEAHWPWTPAATLRGHPVRNVTGLGPRADLVYQLDLALGELEDRLTRLGLADDTLIIVASDNGGDVDRDAVDRGHSTSGDLAGRKGLIAEGGHRIPLIARWGDGTAAGSPIPPGSVSSQLLGLQDLSATLAALVGVATDADQAVDSFDFLPVLLGRQPDSSPVRDHLIVQDGRGPRFALREGEWKLVLDGEGRPQQLFQVAPDGTERSAQGVLPAPDYAARTEAMARRFAELYAAPRTAPTPRPIQKP